MEQRHSGDQISFSEVLSSQAVGLEGFERRRRRLLQRRVQLLQRADRFAQLSAQISGRLAERFQDSLFAVCGHLLLCQGITRAAIHCFEAQNILVSEAGNRAVEDGGALGPQAEVPGNVRGEPGVVASAHQAQGLLDTLLRDKAEEG